MEYGILGPLEVKDGGTMVALGGPKQRAVLALLLLHANQVVSTDRLIDQLWGEEVPDTVKVILQGYISGLRKVLGADHDRDACAWLRDRARGRDGWTFIGSRAFSRRRAPK